MDWKTIVGFTVIFHGVVYAWRREWVLRMETRKFNSCLNSIGQHRIRKYFRAWFRIGTYATIILGFPFTVWLFLRTIFYAIFPSIVAVAVAVTPTSYLPSIEDHTLELHHDPQFPYPDADLSSGSVDTGGSGDAASSSSGTMPNSYLAIQPILPGWNLPLSHLPYYLLAILISVVIHELGHAMASASHKIPIQSIGVSLFGPLIPAAHVELNSVQLQESPIKKQLDILTAGVWMNIYLALITYLVVPKLLPAILWPTHSMGTGLAITGVWPNFGVGGPGGLEPGDVITGIENCPVKDLDSWYSCLEKIWESEPVGFCVTNDTLIKFANNSEGCCGPDGDNSPTHLCFLEMNSGIHSLPSNPNPNVSSDPQPLTQPSDLDPKKLLSNQTAYCLPAKAVVKDSQLPPSSEESDSLSEIDKRFIGGQGRCHSPTYSCSSKSNNEVDSDPDNKVNESHCFVSRLARDLEKFRIVHIHRRQSEKKESVVFVGIVMDLYNGLKTTEFVPRSWFLSRLFGFEGFSKLPEKLETVLLLTAGLSAGLAVVNMLPVYGLDGYHIVDALVRFHFGKRWEGRKISRLVQVISWIALVIAFLTVFCSLAQAL